MAHLRVLNKVLGEEFSDSDNEGFEAMVAWTLIASEKKVATIFALHCFGCVLVSVWVNSVG